MNSSTENGGVGGFDLAIAYKVLITAHLRSLNVFVEDHAVSDVRSEPQMSHNGEEME